MGMWNPWAKPFKDIGDGAGKLLDSLGDEVLGIPHATKETRRRPQFDREKFRLAALLASTSEQNFGVFRLNETRLEAFLGFARREFLNPSEQQKHELVERDDKWWRADEAVFGLRIFTSSSRACRTTRCSRRLCPDRPTRRTIKPTAITLDSIDGLYLGDGEGAGNERVVLPIQFNFPAVEIREVALGIVRNKTKEVTGLELTTVIAAKLGDAVGLQIVGAGRDHRAGRAAGVTRRCSRGTFPALAGRDRSTDQGRADQGWRIHRAQGARLWHRRGQARARRIRWRHPARDPQGRRVRVGILAPTRSRSSSSWASVSRPRSS